MTETVHVDEALMQEIHDAFNARDVDWICRLFTEDGYSPPRADRMPMASAMSAARRSAAS